MSSIDILIFSEHPLIREPKNSFPELLCSVVKLHLHILPPNESSNLSMLSLNKLIAIPPSINYSKSYFYLIIVSVMLK